MPAPEKMFVTLEDGTPRVHFNSGEDDDGARDLILEKCYRNSRPVLVTAHALGFGIYRKPSGENDPGLVQMFENPGSGRTSVTAFGTGNCGTGTR